MQLDQYLLDEIVEQHPALAPYQAKGLTIFTPAFWKSGSFRVTTVRP
jgi:hypothetical protein